MSVTVTIANHPERGICVHKQGCRDAKKHDHWDIEVSTRLEAALDYWGIMASMTDEQAMEWTAFFPCVEAVLPA